jgi:glycosyltransferase involved in cell wall biosynthesis
MNSALSDRRHLFHVFPSFAVGGSQIRFAQIANHFAASYRHTVVTLDGNFEARARVNGDVELTIRAIAFDKKKSLANLPLFARELRAARPDLLVTYNWGAIEWAMANRLATRRRHIHIEDGFGPEEASGQLQRRANFRRLALGGRCTTVVLPSQTLQRIALGTWRLKPAKILYIPNGIDVRRFADATAMPSDKLPGSGPIVGTVAALRAEKNVARLLRVFAQATAQRKARLLIVGDGPERAALEALARELKIVDRIFFAGALKAPEHALKAMDVFAISSDTEQMPYGVIEAMAASRPVAGTDVGDIAVMVAPENRKFIVARDDEARFATVLGELLGNAAQRSTIGAANQARAREHYDQATMFASYAKLFG